MLTKLQLQTQTGYVKRMSLGKTHVSPWEGEIESVFCFFWWARSGWGWEPKELVSGRMLYSQECEKRWL